MINNGTIKALISESSGFDDNGDPIPLTPNWGAAILCQIKTVKFDNKGSYQDGKFTQSCFEVLIKMQEFSAKRVMLRNSGNGFEAEFQVQDIQFLDAVQMVKIIV